LEEAVQSGAKGLMLKMLGNNETEGNVNKEIKSKEIKLTEQMSPYKAGTCSNSWLKVKQDYNCGYTNTIHVVPIEVWKVGACTLCVF
jgi:ATP-dependent DNA ligase